MPSDDALADYYRASYRWDYQNVRRTPTRRHIEKRKIEAETRLKKIDGHLNVSDVIIDFGCGSGEFIELAIQRGYNARGFEPGEDYAFYAKNDRNLPVVNCGWNAFPMPEEKVSAVTSFHVFEHLTQPLSAMKQAVTWLEDDGIFFVEVPNMTNALRKGFGCLHMAHTIGFSRYSLELLGAAAGLKVIDVFDEYDIGIIFRKGNPRIEAEIIRDAVTEMAQWTQPIVHNQYWKYLFSRVLGR